MIGLRRRLHQTHQNAAYILVKCQMGLEEKVLNSLKKVNGVVEVEQVYGTPYDIIVTVVCDSPKKLETAVWRIRKFPRIISSETMLVAEL